jgi:putative salt-induced outer membrane protein YdiY
LAAAEVSENWILPNYWFNSVDWQGSVEIGISGTDGNSESASFRAGMNLKRKVNIHETTFDLTYVNTTANGLETQNNAIQNFGYERNFGDTRWSFFAKEFAEYDEFKAFDLRIVMNAGIGYKFIDTELTEFKGRYGTGVSHEIGGPNDDWIPELVYGADFKRQLTTRQKLELKVDYFPEWGNFDNYRMVTNLGWEVLLDEEHNLNLKFSVNDRYDSTPNGRKPNDINYALLLLWKL